jgi:hypothetical protein
MAKGHFWREAVLANVQPHPTFLAAASSVKTSPR